MSSQSHDDQPFVLSRRSFLAKSAVAAGGALTLPQFLAAAAQAGSLAGGVVRVAIPGDPVMNPVIGNDASAVPFCRTVFSFLTRPDPRDLRPTPDLATRWDSSRDFKTWTFRLRPGVKWSDGEPLTAEDVAYTIGQALLPRNGSSLRGGLLTIYQAKAINKTTIRFKLRTPVGPFPAIASYNVGIVPKHILAGTDLKTNGSFNSQRPVSSGPFYVKEAVPGDHYTLAANPNYYLGKPKLDSIVFKVLGDVNAQIAQMRSGELDYIVIPPTSLSAVDGASNLRGTSTPYIGFYHLSFNYKHPLFADPQVRKALVMAIDRPGIIKTVMRGQAQPGVTPIPPIFAWAFDKTLKPPAYAPETAKQMLRDAGWRPGSDGVLVKDGRKFSFTLDADTADPARQQSAVIAQQNFKAIGLDVNLRIRPFPAYVPDLIGKRYEAHVGFWVLPPDPDLTNYYSTAGGFNTINYDSATVNALLAKGRATADPAAREVAYKQLQRAFLNDPPGAILFYPRDIHVINKQIRGIPPLPYRESLQYSANWTRG